MVHQFQQGFRRKHLDAVHQLPFLGIAPGDVDGVPAFFPGPENHGQNAADGPQAAVQGQFSGKDRRIVLRQLDMLFGCQDAQGNGQVQAGAVLFQVRRRQIYRNVGIGKVEPGVFHRRLYPFLGLLYRRIRQSHHFKGGQAVGHIHFHGHHFSVNASGGFPPCACIHLFITCFK